MLIRAKDLDYSRLIAPWPLHCEKQRLRTASCAAYRPTDTQCSAALDASRSAHKRDTDAPPRPPLRRLRHAGGEIQLPEVPRGVLFDLMLSHAQSDVRRPSSKAEIQAEAGRAGEARRPATGSRF